MKPLLILSLLAVLAGCKEKPVVQTARVSGNNIVLGSGVSFVNTHTPTDDQLDDVIKALRILAAHADPSPRVYTTDAVLRSRSQELLIEAKRQEAREAEYAWAKSVLAELEKRK